MENEDSSNIYVPVENRNRRRLSSILKLNKSPLRNALAEIGGNVQSEDTTRRLSTRRVSFADVTQVKEFHVDSLESWDHAGLQNSNSSTKRELNKTADGEKSQNVDGLDKPIAEKLVCNDLSKDVSKPIKKKSKKRKSVAPQYDGDDDVFVNELDQSLSRRSRLALVDVDMPQASVETCDQFGGDRTMIGDTTMDLDTTSLNRTYRDPINATIIGNEGMDMTCLHDKTITYERISPDKTVLFENTDNFMDLTCAGLNDTKVNQTQPLEVEKKISAANLFRLIGFEIEKPVFGKDSENVSDEDSSNIDVLESSTEDVKDSEQATTEGAEEMNLRNICTDTLARIVAYEDASGTDEESFGDADVQGIVIANVSNLKNEKFIRAEEIVIDEMELTNAKPDECEATTMVNENEEIPEIGKSCNADILSSSISKTVVEESVNEKTDDVLESTHNDVSQDGLPVFERSELISEKLIDNVKNASVDINQHVSCMHEISESPNKKIAGAETNTCIDVSQEGSPKHDIPESINEISTDIVKNVPTNISQDGSPKREISELIHEISTDIVKNVPANISQDRSHSLEISESTTEKLTNIGKESCNDISQGGSSMHETSKSINEKLIDDVKTISTDVSQVGFCLDKTSEFIKEKLADDVKTVSTDVSQDGLRMLEVSELIKEKSTDDVKNADTNVSQDGLCFLEISKSTSKKLADVSQHGSCVHEISQLAIDAKYAFTNVSQDASHMREISESFSNKQANDVKTIPADVSQHGSNIHEITELANDEKYASTNVSQRGSHMHKISESINDKPTDNVMTASAEVSQDGSRMVEVSESFSNKQANDVKTIPADVSQHGSSIHEISQLANDAKHASTNVSRDGSHMREISESINDKSTDNVMTAFAKVSQDGSRIHEVSESFSNKRAIDVKTISADVSQHGSSIHEITKLANDASTNVSQDGSHMREISESVSEKITAALQNASVNVTQDRTSKHEILDCTHNCESILEEASSKLHVEMCSMNETTNINVDFDKIYMVKRISCGSKLDSEIENDKDQDMEAISNSVLGNQVQKVAVETCNTVEPHVLIDKTTSADNCSSVEISKNTLVADNSVHETGAKSEVGSNDSFGTLPSIVSNSDVQSQTSSYSGLTGYASSQSKLNLSDVRSLKSFTEVLELAAAEEMELENEPLCELLENTTNITNVSALPRMSMSINASMQNESTNFLMKETNRVIRALNQSSLVNESKYSINDTTKEELQEPRNGRSVSKLNDSSFVNDLLDETSMFVEFENEIMQLPPESTDDIDNMVNMSEAVPNVSVPQVIDDPQIHVPLKRFLHHEESTGSFITPVKTKRSKTSSLFSPMSPPRKICCISESSATKQNRGLNKVGKRATVMKVDSDKDFLCSDEENVIPEETIHNISCDFLVNNSYDATSPNGMEFGAHMVPNAVAVSNDAKSATTLNLTVTVCANKTDASEGLQSMKNVDVMKSDTVEASKMATICDVTRPVLNTTETVEVCDSNKPVLTETLKVSPVVTSSAVKKPISCDALIVSKAATVFDIPACEMLNTVETIDVMKPVTGEPLNMEVPDDISITTKAECSNNKGLIVSSQLRGSEPNLISNAMQEQTKLNMENFEANPEMYNLMFYTKLKKILQSLERVNKFLVARNNAKPSAADFELLRHKDAELAAKEAELEEEKKRHAEALIALKQAQERDRILDQQIAEASAEHEEHMKVNTNVKKELNKYLEAVEDIWSLSEACIEARKPTEPKFLFKFTYLRDTLRLQIMFGEPAPPCAAAEKLKILPNAYIESVTLSKKVENCNRFTRFAQEYVLTGINVDVASKRYTALDAHKVLTDVSLMVSEGRSLIRELKLINFNHKTVLENWKFTVEFSSVEAHAMFFVSFEITPGKYPQDVGISFSNFIGKFSETTILKMLKQVPVTCHYLTNLVQAVDDCLKDKAAEVNESFMNCTLPGIADVSFE